MGALTAAIQVLKEAGEPLHYKEITQRILDQGLWSTKGATPEATVNAVFAVEISKRGDEARVLRVGKGLFAVSDAPSTKPTKPQSSKTPKAPKLEKVPKPLTTTSAETMSFTESAEYILKTQGDRQPMHYKQITKMALSLGLLSTQGLTPDASMYASIVQEIGRRRRRGDKQRFVQHGKGMVGLQGWVKEGIPAQVRRHNDKVRKAFRARLGKMDAGDFEVFVGAFLVAIGFEDVEVTSRHGDRGIDVRGTLVVADVVRTKMAVQVKRWSNNVQAPTVQQVRGALGAHEQGLIVTTSDFSPGAREEAARPDATPVALMNGEQLVALLLEHEIGVERESIDLFELKEEGDEADEA